MGKDTEIVSMKKICFFVNSGWYFELHWLERAIALKNNNNEVHIVSHFSNAEIQRLKSLGFYCHETDMHERSLRIIDGFVDLSNSVAILKKINPDIIHAITIKPILIGGLFCRLKCKCFIASFVGLGRVFMSHSLLYKLIRKIVTITYKIIFKNSKSLLLFEHSSDKKLLTNLIGISPTKCIVINGSGVNIEEFNYAYEKDTIKPSVLFASRMIWSKGLGDLVKIKKEIDLDIDIDFDLNVAGIYIEDDADSIPLEVIHAWSNDGLINWLGKIDNVSSLIEKNSIVVLPSTYYEGIPRILIESAAKGRPIIAYDIGGCRNIIKNGITGFLIKKGDVSELKDKITFLLSDVNLRRKMGEHGRKLVEEKFCSDIIVKETIQIYVKVLTL
ncbi:glycosyltransferase family 4 protein [Pantoea ananatis]|uniref:glycosyltransferase family 4 protein n=1 Tax=Pantoea ananas TaxID=553 RepID=UPI002350702D|nr:glycosyltransferase family 4 protein [Pantoea ananatis]